MATHNLWTTVFACKIRKGQKKPVPVDKHMKKNWASSVKLFSYPSFKFHWMKWTEKFYSTASNSVVWCWAWKTLAFAFLQDYTSQQSSSWECSREHHSTGKNLLIVFWKPFYEHRKGVPCPFREKCMRLEHNTLYEKSLESGIEESLMQPAHTVSDTGVFQPLRCHHSSSENK